MGKTIEQIENQIETTRADLKSNFQELETRVKSATDWRHYFREHPGAMMAVAFGGGLLLSRLTRQRPGSSSVSRATGTKHEVLKTFDAMSSALVGAAATKLKRVLADAVPGFADQLAQNQADRSRDSAH